VSAVDSPERSEVPPLGEVLVVCAHPDDESFGLGAVIAALADRGSRVRVLCLTHGEASTLGEGDRPLGEVRAKELASAAAALGIEDVALLSYSDGHLHDVPLDELADLIDAGLGAAEALLVFDEGGITGHSDHCRATEAALLVAGRHHLAVLAWVVPEAVAAQLDAELGTSFVGRTDTDVDLVIEVDRDRQRAAIACHASQSGENPVLWRRLELTGNREHLRWLARG
jgi:LmbE family N-acetylglucosaminyl deacetylase